MDTGKAAFVRAIINSVSHDRLAGGQWGPDGLEAELQTPALPSDPTGQGHL